MTTTIRCRFARVPGFRGRFAVDDSPRDTLLARLPAAKLSPARAGSRMPSRRRFLRIAFLCGAIQITTAVVAAQAVQGSSAGEPVSPCASRQLVISLGTFVPPSATWLCRFVSHETKGRPAVCVAFPMFMVSRSAGGSSSAPKPSLKGYFGQWHIATITLKNGQAASALLEGLDPTFLSRPPPSSRIFGIRPPNASHRVRRRTKYAIFSLLIHPLVAGLNGGGNGAKSRPTGSRARRTQS